MKYYEIVIQETSKPMGNTEGEDYSTFNMDRETFPTLKEAKEYLKERYGDVKKVKIHIDDKGGKSSQIGWIYCFKNSDISHNSDTWWQQDWVEVREIHSEPIVV